MNLSELLTDRLIQAFGWTILHSLWQGAVIAILLGVLMILMRRYSSQARYFVSVSALMTIFVLAVGTFVVHYRDYQEPTVSAVTFALPTPALPAQQDSVERVAQASTWQMFWANTEGYFKEHLPLMVSVWLMGVVLLLLRFIGGYAYLQRLRSYQVIEVSNYWQGTLQYLATEIGFKHKVRLLESALAEMPMAIGWLKPVILLPIGTLSGLSIAQVESILAHELAHLKRQDYLVNIFQSIVEIVLFYNPFVWWVSGYIREERENCCDDIAVAATGDSMTLIKTLTMLEELRLARPQLAMGFAGRKRGGLLARVRRLLSRKPQTSGFSEGFLSAMVLVFCFSITTVNAYTPYNWQNLRTLAGKSWEKIQSVASTLVGKAGNVEILDNEPTKTTLPAPTLASEVDTKTEIRIKGLAPLKPLGIKDTIRFGKGYMGITDRTGKLKIFKEGKEIPKEEFEKHKGEFSVIETPRKAYNNKAYVYAPYDTDKYTTYYDLAPLPVMPPMPPMPAIPAIPAVPSFRFEYDGTPRGRVYAPRSPNEVIIIDGKRMSRKDRKRTKKGEGMMVPDANDFGKDWEKWGEDVGKRFEKWGGQFEKQGEAWEKWGEKMEKWGEEFGKHFELSEKDRTELEKQAERFANEHQALEDKIRNLKDKQREDSERDREARREAMQDLQEQQRELQKQAREMQQEAREKALEAQERALEAQQDAQEKRFEENFKPLRDELVKDGLSESNPTSCKIEAGKNGITVNGKKLSPEQEAKYKPLIHKTLGMPKELKEKNTWIWHWEED